MQTLSFHRQAGARQTPFACHVWTSQFGSLNQHIAAPGAGAAIFKGLQRLTGTLVAGLLGVGTQCEDWQQGRSGHLVLAMQAALG